MKYCCCTDMRYNDRVKSDPISASTFFTYPIHAKSCFPLQTMHSFPPTYCYLPIFLAHWPIVYGQ